MSKSFKTFLDMGGVSKKNVTFNFASAATNYFFLTHNIVLYIMATQGITLERSYRINIRNHRNAEKY